MMRLLLQGMNVGPGELEAMRHAAGLLSRELGAVSGEEWQAEARAVDTVADCDRGSEPVLLVTSLSGEIDNIDAPWPETAARLHDLYAGLTADAGLMVFVCTVLRHIPDIADRPARLQRLRRLNMLAMELSQAYGIHVIDIDRTLADIGARALETDYALTGPYAADAAAKSIAMTVLAAGIDDLVPFELQDAARERIAAWQPPRSGADAPGMMAPARIDRAQTNLITVRVGRRVEYAAMAHDGAPENRVQAYIRMLMRGQLSPRDAVAILARVISINGVSGTAAKIFKGFGMVTRSLFRGRMQEKRKP